MMSLTQCDPSHPRPGMPSPQSTSSQTSPSSSAVMSRTTSNTQPITHALSSSTAQYGDTLFMQHSVSPTLSAVNHTGSFTTPSPTTSRSSSVVSTGLVQQGPPTTTDPAAQTVRFSDIYPHSGRPSTLSSSASHGGSLESRGVVQRLSSGPGDSMPGGLFSPLDYNPQLQSRSSSQSSSASSQDSSWSHSLSSASTSDSSSSTKLGSPLQDYRFSLQKRSGDSIARLRSDQDRSYIIDVLQAQDQNHSRDSHAVLQTQTQVQERDSVPGLLHASASQPKQRSLLSSDSNGPIVSEPRRGFALEQPLLSPEVFSGVLATTSRSGALGSSDFAGRPEHVHQSTSVNAVSSSDVHATASSGSPHVVTDSGALRTVVHDSSASRHGRRHLQHGSTTLPETLQQRTRYRAVQETQGSAVGSASIVESSIGASSGTESRVLQRQDLVVSSPRSTSPTTPLREKIQEKVAPLSSRSSPIMITDDNHNRISILAKNTKMDSISDLSTTLPQQVRPQLQAQLTVPSGVTSSTLSRTQPASKQIKSLSTPRTTLGTNSILPAISTATSIFKSTTILSTLSDVTQMFGGATKQQHISQSLWKTFLSLILLIAIQCLLCSCTPGGSGRVDSLGYPAFETGQILEHVTPFVAVGHRQQRLIDIL